MRDRMARFTGSVCLLVLAVLAGVSGVPGMPASAQTQDFSKVEVTATKVAGNVYMLTGAGGNIGVSVGSDGLLIVDDQFAPLADKIHAALKGLSPASLKFVLNTHWHGDHTGGNAAFGAEAPIIAQENVRKRMSAEQTLRGAKVPASPKGALPVVTFGDKVSIHFNGEEIKVVHFAPGHTDGDSVIFFTGSNVVHMGDDFATGRFPFIDLENGGNVQGMTETVAKVLAQLPADVKIIPGHGALSSKADLEKFHRMLVETTAFVQKGMQAGKTLEAIQKEGLPEEWRELGNGPIKNEAWISYLYQSLDKGAHGQKPAGGTQHH